MNTYIALFRGINVGGNSLLPMKELVADLQNIGCRSVQTYIQSGNAVFASPEADASRLADAIRSEIRRRHGFEPYILLLSLAELGQAMAQNPFPEAEANPQVLHLGFLAVQPSNPDLPGLARIKADSERFQLIGRVFYLFAPEGVGRSKLAAGAEKLLGVVMTDRNWRSVCAIAGLAGKLAAQEDFE
ncbi:uncharacterized protein conserved in bacteria [Longilinea arvoryzae]|uniref:Uncharacterized protein conserved in bacteria n=1 Tax=Longilinea arvoryzae TaxID=360412 RepID=A0A0S7BBR6_9CHLR|nr:DUF1697 domain-containing protein [Longilinea arvoryzae]GAP12701.1 uncharacterized protein conserved in bacteria [Longilinea arvoryzae]